MALTRVVDHLSLPASVTVSAAICQIMAVKVAMQAIVEGINGAPVCASCGGMCCTCGRYHFSAVDLVAYLVTGKKLFMPRFGGNGCIFLDGDRCLMPPAYRPFNCITFVCESLEDKFSPEEKAAFYGMERELRRLYQELCHQVADPRMQRSVLTFVGE